MDATLPPGPVEKHRGAGEVTAELVLCGDAKPTITQCHCTSPAIPCQLRGACPRLAPVRRKLRADIGLRPPAIR